MAKTTIKASSILRNGKPTNKALVLEDFLGDLAITAGVNIAFTGLFNVMADYTMTGATAFALDANKIHVPGIMIVKVTGVNGVAPTFPSMSALTGTTAWNTTGAVTHFIEFIYDGTKVRYRVTTPA
jgi:hypothetical protein